MNTPKQVLHDIKQRTRVRWPAREYALPVTMNVIIGGCLTLIDSEREPGIYLIWLQQEAFDRSRKIPVAGNHWDENNSSEGIDNTK